MRPITSRTIAALAACALLAGCGDDDDESSGTRSAAATTATAAATEAPAGPLAEDALLAVHDTLYECLRKAEVGAVVAYSNGEASIDYGGESQPEFEAALGAPEATKEVMEAGAQYVGLRDDKRKKGRTPDWDILMFASEEDAKAAYPPLSDEVGDPAGAVQTGRFVTVVLPDADANGDDPEAAETAVVDCQKQAEKAA